MKELFRFKGTHPIKLTRDIWGETPNLQTLGESFLKKEIKEAIWGLAVDKAPGTDGFLIISFKRHN